MRWQVSPRQSVLLRCPPRCRRGQALVEFALVSLVIYLLLAAIVTFGYMLFVAQGLQQATDLAAREISRTPLEPEMTLAEALQDEAVRETIFDKHYLVLDFDGGANLNGLIPQLPLVNQQLLPLMIADTIEGRRVLRYPGVVVSDDDPSDNPDSPPPSGYLVLIPRVVSRSPDGATTVEWVDAIEEIRAAGATESPFQLSSTQRGVAAVRMNYPFQSPVMSSFQPNPAGPFEPSIGMPNLADDSQVNAPPGTAVPSDREFGPYTGTRGLGQQAAYGQAVRPYSKLISAQAVYRREAFR